MVWVIIFLINSDFHTNEHFIWWPIKIEAHCVINLTKIKHVYEYWYMIMHELQFLQQSPCDYISLSTLNNALKVT